MGYRRLDGRMVFEPLDVNGYFDSIDRTRHEFPDLSILTGVEFGQPHLFEAVILAESFGFRPGAVPADLWRLSTVPA